MIDVHVHLRDGSQAAKETVLHGLSVCARCGIDACFDMPNTDVPLIGERAVSARLETGKAALDEVKRNTGRTVTYGVYGGLTGDPGQIASMVALHRKLFPAMVGFKLYAGHSTGSMGVIDPRTQQSVYRTLARCGYRGVLAVHCEKESLLQPDLWDPSKPESHCDARPAHAEIASVADQIAFARESGFAGTLHICHISTAGALSLVEEARTSGMRITCGATGHHALLDKSVAGRPGNLCRMNPPLRPSSDRRAIFSALADGQIDWIESDHAPHTLEDKAAGASGIPSFAGTLVLVDRLRRHGVTEARLAALCAERANEVFGMDLPVTVPSDDLIARELPFARNSYPWDPFDTIR